MTMELIKTAAKLTEKGFWIFPLRQNSKLPAVKDFANVATRDPALIMKIWREPYNIGISTSKYSNDLYLLAVDVDNKGTKKGNDSILGFELEGKLLPPTTTQTTPTGGKHLIYFTRVPLGQSVGKIANGIDTRALGGYVVGAGSTLDGKEYTIDTTHSVAEAPEWLVQMCQAPREKKVADPVKVANLNTARASMRAIEYLLKEAPESIKGQGGDQTAFTVAAKVKDFGVPQDTALELMCEHWFGGSGWSPERLKEKIDHAYKYGKEEVGSLAPESDFTPVVEEKKVEEKKENPVLEMNKEYAFIVIEGSSHILWETKDHKGRQKVMHLDHVTFHNKFLSKTFQDGNGKYHPITKLWMSHPQRRSFDGLCFMPGKKCPPNFYNLWRGFSCEPANEKEIPNPKAHNALKDFIEHCFENVCEGKQELFNWVMGYFAHMIQKPWEKPLTALVFRGKKGVGKNALVGRVAHLLRNHSLLASNKRFLLGNFNGHLENLILFTLDEAFWSGDKQAEGILKDLITGDHHLIEHKGKQPYVVDNCLRVIILGNENWIVPASADERRYGVFDVGKKRQQDRKFFQDMKDGMELHGGDRLLLRYLMDFDISKIDINDAPKTKGLADQKTASLEPFPQYWFECLEAGRIVESSMPVNWSKLADKDDFRTAFGNYLKKRQIPSRIPDVRLIGKLLLDYCPSIKSTRVTEEGHRRWYYELPDLKIARKEWEKYIGAEIDWGSDD